MHYCDFEWSSMSDIMAKLLGPFSIIKICNIKLNGWTKLKKMANNWMDHSKRPTRRTKKILKSLPGFFRTCGFRGVLKKRLLYHKIGLSENSLPRFSVKIRPKSKKAHFWHVFVIFEWSRIFPGNPAVLFFLPYHPLTSYQVSSKSLQRFSGSSVHTRAGIRRQTHQHSQAWPPLKWRIVSLCPLMFWERKMHLTCGFRGESDEGLNFGFQVSAFGIYAYIFYKTWKNAKNSLIFGCFGL